jgi:alginate O-acetyltransferase complex protein AlgJ
MSMTGRLLSIRASLHVLIGAALFAIPILTLWNLAVERTHPNLKVTLGQRLGGVTAAAPALQWSWGSLADGSLQRQIGAMITDAMPLRPLLIRLGNEFRYTFFGEYNSPALVAGRSGQLVLEYVYEEYCTRQADLSPPMHPDMTANLQTIQDYYRRRNRVFLFLVTPSKIAHMPENFVDDANCKNDPRDRASKLPAWRRILHDAGINYFDGASHVYGLRGRYPIDVFPLRGLHWNALGAAHTAQALAAEINRSAGRRLMRPFTFNYERLDRAYGTDRDLADLANLLVPRVRYPTAYVTFQPPCDFRAGPLLDVALVGSSFLGQLSEAMVAGSCLRRLNFYLYLNRARYSYNDGVVNEKIGLDEADIAPLHDADVMILEENEGALGEGNYIAKLAEMLSGR